MIARSLATVALLPWLLPSGTAAAHPIVVDGSGSDWFGEDPTGFNVGRVHRDNRGFGELVWADETGDSRTDLSSPEDEADITRVLVTATTSDLFVRIDTNVGAGGLTGLQVQVAIDLDRVAGSGQTFLGGFSDTTVHTDAQWEFLLQSQRTGATPTLDVLDAGFTRSAGAGSIAFGAGIVEMRVPWSALGLVSPAPAARFTFATFREGSMGNVVDLGGPSQSDALDVVTDYADQPATSLNTFAEVSDMRVDHYTEIYFLRATGEVYSPLLVTRFLSHASAAVEWAEITNASGTAIDLAGLKIGDEETPGGGEGMRRFGSGSIASGGSLSVADGAFDWGVFYGGAAERDWSIMPAFTGWATGAVQLNDTGDQIVLLGRDNTVLDVVNYGTATADYPGVARLAEAPGPDVLATRTPRLSDTDDTQVDFTVADTCGLAGCGPCRSCAALVCSDLAAGTDCGDGDVCNGEETCDGAGACAAGTALDCDDSEPCTTDSCDPTGGCANVARADGDACGDGDACNGDEVCAAGVCRAGAPPSCDDGNDCTADRCEPATGCASAPLPDGTSCADDDRCDGDEVCAAGVCVGVAPLDCDDANACTTDSCAPATGCVNAAVADGTGCADDDVCDGDEVCAAGACAGGVPLDCDDADPCTADTCDAVTGCASAPVADGTSCADDDVCDGEETCRAGACTGSAALDCDDGDPCTADACDAVDGCANTAVADGTSCADDDVCDGEETCRAGACTDSAALDCDDGDPCTADACDAVDGCASTPIDGCADGGVPDGGAGDGGPGDDAGPPGDDAGSPGGDDAGPPGDDAGPPAGTDAGPPTARDAGGFADAGPLGRSDSGCSCRTPAGRSRPAAWAWLAVAALLVRRRLR